MALEFPNHGAIIVHSKQRQQTVELIEQSNRLKRSNEDTNMTKALPTYAYKMSDLVAGLGRAIGAIRLAKAVK